MFFLLRMAFWLGLVLVLLPTDKTPDSDKGLQIGASDAISAATAAMSDMSQFCNRQPTACVVGATKVYQFITDKADKNEKKVPDSTDKAGKKAPDHTGSIGTPDDRTTGESEVAAVVHQTLTQDDLAIDWQPPGATAAP